VVLRGKRKIQTEPRSLEAVGAGGTEKPTHGALPQGKDGITSRDSKNANAIKEKILVERDDRRHQKVLYTVPRM
jgi:hypothetical protein